MRRIEHTKKTAQMADWHKAYIVAALHAAGTSLRKLSVAHGYKPSALKHALHTPWPKAERIIAATLGEKPNDIWPTRYGTDGKPLSAKGARQAIGQGRHVKHCTKAKTRRNVQLKVVE